MIRSSPLENRPRMGPLSVPPENWRLHIDAWAEVSAHPRSPRPSPLPPRKGNVPTEVVVGPGRRRCCRIRSRRRPSGKFSPGLEAHPEVPDRVVVFRAIGRRRVTRPGSGRQVHREEGGFEPPTNSFRSAGLGCGFLAGGMSPLATTWRTRSQSFRSARMAAGW